MALFLGHIAFLVAIFAIAYGLAFLQRSDAERRRYDHIAGWLLVVFGTLNALCTAYYMFHYYSLGSFDQAYPFTAQMIRSM